ncbi:NAD(P)/FAD-dependent oxidoreductase [Cohnella cholangitidis]|uniref:Nitrite reductase n=1 Tax=Cohnella cholangitidis TaxID=2598458 RepID=A0A7G5BSF6_9BACL|nr:nitrite reductase [Cohnella cholangitidis]QMV39890.1 nitrite reductase [Cohnella cholangitidis]
MSHSRIAVTSSMNTGGTLFRPEQLVLIGSAAEPGTTIEMTPFKQLYVSVDTARLQDAQQELIQSGLRVLPTGFVTKSLQACNFCKGAEEAGLSFARRLDEAISGLEVPVPLKIGYAGCALGTSEPLTKEISVVKMRDTFDLYAGGDVKGIKPVFAELLLTKLAEEDVIPAIQRIIQHYRAHSKGKEKFNRFINRIGLDDLRKLSDKKFSP